jgi:hypothetical protein
MHYIVILFAFYASDSNNIPLGRGNGVFNR